MLNPVMLNPTIPAEWWHALHAEADEAARRDVMAVLADWCNDRLGDPVAERFFRWVHRTGRAPAHGRPYGWRWVLADLVYAGEESACVPYALFTRIRRQRRHMPARRAGGPATGERPYCRSAQRVYAEGELLAAWRRAREAGLGEQAEHTVPAFSPEHLAPIWAAWGEPERRQAWLTLAVRLAAAGDRVTAGAVCWLVETARVPTSDWVTRDGPQSLYRWLPVWDTAGVAPYPAAVPHHLARALDAHQDLFLGFHPRSRLEAELQLLTACRMYAADTGNDPVTENPLEAP